MELLPPAAYTVINGPGSTLTVSVFVLPSHAEGWGLPALEAMASGAAVVTTDSGGVRGFALDGTNCLMVPAQRPNQLAEAVLTLMYDSSRRMAIASAGVATAAKFDWDDESDHLSTLLAECVAASTEAYSP